MSSVFLKDVDEFSFNILKFTKTVAIHRLSKTFIYTVCAVFNYYQKHPSSFNT